MMDGSPRTLWKQAAVKRFECDETVSDEKLFEALLIEIERLEQENKRLKQSLFKSATAGKPAMSTKLFEALRE